MAAGDLKKPRKREQAAVEAAVARAEARTGLQFCVYVGRVDDEQPRAHAEALFVDAGLHELPAVLIVVAPAARRIEVVVGSSARARITDDAAARAVEAMTKSFRAGRLAPGLVAALDALAAAAGPGAARAEDAKLPDVVGDL